MKHSLPFMLAVALLAGCGSYDNRGALDAKAGYVCKASDKTVYKPWGESGLSKTCIGPTGQVNGTYMAADWGRIIFIENFDESKQHRVIEYYDKAGKVEKRVVGDVAGTP